jgi:hypothetical protein
MTTKDEETLSALLVLKFFFSRASSGTCRSAGRVQDRGVGVAREEEDIERVKGISQAFSTN